MAEHARFDDVKHPGFSANEMQQATCEMRGPEAWSEFFESSKHLSKLVDDFEVVDLDNNGKLEPWKFRYEQDRAKLLPPDVAVTVEKFHDHFRRYTSACSDVSKASLEFVRDSNDTGFTEKLIAERERQLNFQAFASELKTNFALFDSNHDNSITRDEVETAMDRDDLTLSQTVNAAYLNSRFNVVSEMNHKGPITHEALTKADRAHDGDWLLLPHINRYGRMDDLYDLSNVVPITLAAGAGLAAFSETATGVAFFAAGTAAAVAMPVAVMTAALALGAGGEYLHYKHDQYERYRKELELPMDIPAIRRF